MTTSHYIESGLTLEALEEACEIKRQMNTLEERFVALLSGTHDAEEREHTFRRVRGEEPETNAGPTRRKPRTRAGMRRYWEDVHAGRIQRKGYTPPL